MGTVIKARLPLLLLLGIVFLASVSVSFGLAYWEKETPSHDKCLNSCNRENDGYRHHACQARCNLIKNTADSHESEEQQPWRQRGRHQGQEQEERDPREQEQEQERRRQQEQEQEQEQERRRKEQQQREQEEEEEERQRRREKKREEQEEREQEQQSRRKKNPYHFSSKRFQTRYKNKYGQIRVLQRFNQRSKKLQNLQYYGIVECELKPNTLFLPHHSDADFILVVSRGKATITVLFPDNRESYNLECGEAMRLPAGITASILNRDNNQNLTVVKLAISVNRPGKFEDFFLTPTPNKPSYIDGFSRNFLEASYNATYEEIQRNLLGDKKQEQSQEEGVIVQVSEELIQELTKHAKSSSKKGKHSESGPFNLRSSNPIYSNKFGKFYEVTPDKNPQLQDLDIALTSAEINEGALMLPHFNSKAIVVVVVNEGEGRVELVGLRKQQQQEQQEEEEQQQEQEEQQEEEEGNRQVHRYTAKLSPGDIFIVPESYPVAFNASSFLHLLGFGINAENNQRTFLAGEKDNVISLIPKQVKELAFPGSGKAVGSLIKKQKQSYFANAQSQQREEGKQEKRGPLSSILGAFY